MTRSDSDWPVTWAANRRVQLRASLAATAHERLEWLEEVVRLAERSGALARRREMQERAREEDQAPAPIVRSGDGSRLG